ncbi:hypothetical protein PGT21_004812 [Puccinia graminis f. sp. tritici]|uniref:Uncharacterized protein n=1 Tax=Puccinia graminis f. sp. tritici TaxID=56615 RepID=A0A5B0QMH5_PUCGR|nr:hypothetical protein PGT21_004812 [Puccinia graminis f. sp. tritici]
MDLHLPHATLNSSIQHMPFLHNTTHKRTKQQEINQPNKPDPPSSNQTHSKTNTYLSEKKVKVKL